MEKNNAVENLIQSRIQYKKIMGVNRFYSSDISEIMNECWDQNIDITTKDLIAQIGDRMQDINREP